MKSPHEAPSAPDPRISRRAVALACAGVALAGIAAYANGLSGPFIFDDLLSIPQNPTIRRLLSSLAPPGGGLTVTGRPVLNFSFALNHTLSGDRVWSYHALNLLIHVLAGLTLFGIVRRTFARPQARHRGPAVPEPLSPEGEATFLAFAVALLWTVHPLQTEAVTYIVQRAESLMGLFYLLTLYCFIRGAIGGPLAPSGAGRGDEPGRGIARLIARLWPWGTAGTAPLWFLGSWLACLLGMGTKEVMVSAPVIVFLYDRTFLAGSFRDAWRKRRRIHLALAATWIPLAAEVHHAADRGGTAGFGIGVGFWAYAATQFQAVSHYLRLSFWPHPLILDYGAQWARSFWDVAPYAALVALLAAVTAAALVRRPALGFLGAWFFAILAPTSLVPGGRQTLAEQRMYLPLAAVAVLAILALHRWLGRRSRFVVAAAAVALGWATAERNTVYRSDLAIWRDTVAKRPGNAAAHNNYGNILAQAGRPEEAVAQYDEAIRLDPGYAEAYFNAGNALAKLGRPAEAIARYEEALDANPRMPDAQAALGLALEAAGRREEAIARYEEALLLDPGYTDARNDLGLALAREGRIPEAIAQYEEALRADPSSPEIHDNLGNALLAAGRADEAVAQYEQALRLDPGFAAAHNNLGNIYRQRDRQPEAVAQYEAALRSDPASPEIRNNLGVSLLLEGRAQEAIAQFRQALRLDPSLARVHLNLAAALASVGRTGEATEEYETARRLGAALPEPAK